MENINDGHSTLLDKEFQERRLEEQALAIYDNRLKQILEPQYNGQQVAIHPESGDYEVSRYLIEAFSGLRARQPKGYIVSVNVGLAAGDDKLSLLMQRQTRLQQSK